MQVLHKEGLVNKSAQKDLVVGCLAECEVQLFNVMQHVDGLDAETRSHVEGAFRGLKAYRERTFNANTCPKCRTLVETHPGGKACT